MIKVNLLKGPAARTARKNSGTNTGAGESNEAISVDGLSVDGDIGELRKEALKRLIIFMIPALGLYAYEEYTLPGYRAELVQKRSNVQSLRTENAKFKQIVAEADKFKEDQNRLQTQIAAIDKLKKDRTREIKVLDLMQTAMPEKVWFTKIDFKDLKYTFVGYSIADSDLNSFLDVLSSSIFFKQVDLLKSSEEYLDGQQIKKFEVVAQVESGNDSAATGSGRRRQ